jgi:hypothetical protein
VAPHLALFAFALEVSLDTLVTVHAPDGRAFGPYPVASGPLEAPTPIKDYERQALSRALEDGLSEREAAGCTFDVVYPKDDDSA